MCQLEGVSAGERSFLVEVVVDGGVNSGELLQASHPTETLHRAVSLSERQVRILIPVVEPPSRPLFFKRAHFSKCNLVGSEAICDDLFGTAMPLHQFSEEFQCCGFISTFGIDCFQHLSFVIDGTPEIMSLPFTFTKTSSTCHFHFENAHSC